MAMPEKIWAGKSLPPPDELAVRTWEPDSAPDFKLWEPTLFIRADLVGDLVKALEDARERVEHWADVASRADRTRYDTSDDLAKIDDALARIKGDGK